MNGMRYAKIGYGPNDSHIVRFCSTGGEEDLRWRYVEKTGDCLSGFLDDSFHLSSVTMDGRWISEIVVHDIDHDFYHFRIQSCSRSIVKIYLHGAKLQI